MTTDTDRAGLVDSLAQEIRRVDGNHSLGAGALAEALMPWIEQTSPAPASGVGEAVTTCEVAVAPATVFGPGMRLSTIMQCIASRDDGPHTFTRKLQQMAHPSPVEAVGGGSRLFDQQTYQMGYRDGASETHLNYASVEAAVERDAWSTNLAQLPADTSVILEDAQGRVWIGHFDSDRGQIYGPSKPVRWCAIPRRAAIDAQNKERS